MKKILATLLLCVAVSSYSQPSEIFELQKPIRCSAVEVLMNYLAQNYGERMVWIGKETNSGTYIALYKNETTGTWTMIQYDIKTGCVLGAGELGSPT